MTIIKFKTSDNELYQSTLQLRDSILRKPYNATLFDDDLTVEKENDFYCVTSNNRTIATISSYWASPCRAILTAFAVATDYQQQGYGSQLLAFVLADLKKQGCQNVSVTSLASAKGFYQRSQFKATGQRPQNNFTSEADYSMTLDLTPL